MSHPLTVTENHELRFQSTTWQRRKYYRTILLWYTRLSALQRYDVDMYIFQFVLLIARIVEVGHHQRMDLTTVDRLLTIYF